MKKQLIILNTLFFSQFVLSQVGINTTDPKATMDIMAKTTDGSKAEGFIAPRLTGDQIRLSDMQYGTDQTGTIIYATSAVTSSSSSKTVNITSPGYYYFDGSVWKKIGGETTSAGNGFSKYILSQGETYTLKPTDTYIGLDPAANGFSQNINLSDAQSYVPGHTVFISNIGNYNNSPINILFNGSSVNNFESQSMSASIPAGWSAMLMYLGGPSSTSGSWAIMQTNL